MANRVGQQAAAAAANSGSSSPTKPGGAQPAAALPPYKAIAEDKKFPRCRLCNYRYFTRIDLHRHLVDRHLRGRITQSVASVRTTCPAPDCGLSFDSWQVCARHYAGRHLALAQVVEQDLGLPLSEFPSSARDVEIEKNKNAQAVSDASPPAKAEFKEVMDLADLPVKSTVDVKCNFPSCELCGEEFTTSVNKVWYFDSPARTYFSILQM